MFPIEFQDPNAVLIGKERKSKLLKNGSSLYKECERKSQILKKKFGDEMGEKRMDFHLELIKDDPTDMLLVERARNIEKMPVDVNKYELTSKSIGIKGPFVSGYGETHITLGYFPKGLPKTDFVNLLM